MKPFLSQILIFLIIGLIILNGIGIILDNYYGTLNNKYIEHKANWVFKKEGHKVDYAVVGSSRAFNIIDIITIDSTLNTNGINLGTAGSAYSQCYILLEKFLRKNHTDLVLLNLDYSNLTSSQSFSYPFADYAFIPQFEDDTIEMVFKEVVPFPKYLMWKYIKGTKYIEFNRKYPSYKNLIRCGAEELYEDFELTKGTVLVTGNQRGQTDSIEMLDDEEITFNSTDLKYLNKIIDLCRNKGIKIVAYAAPYSEDLYVKRGYQRINRKIAKLADDLEIKWLNMSLNNLSYQTEMFADASHLNINGARLFSVQLADSISAEFDR
jgi:hypothetical protein